MTVHQSLRCFLASAALLVAGMTFGAPAAASAATPPHMSVADRLAWPSVPSHEIYEYTAPRFRATQPRMDDSFADIHME